MEMDEVFRFNISLFDDLLMWSARLEALGCITGQIMWAEGHESAVDIIKNYGEHLGMIISDYARAVERGIQELQRDHSNRIQILEAQIKKGAFAETNEEGKGSRDGIEV